ncbi:hypothetical protein ACN2WE_05225 [Streptomyces sp. cg28]
MPDGYCCGGSKSHAEKHRGGRDLPCTWCINHSERVSLFGGCSGGDD